MPGKGFVVKGMHVDIDGVHYECEVTGVDESESHDTQNSTTACPTDGAVVDIGPSSYTVDVTANVDVATGSLYRLLTDPANVGKLADIAWYPDLVNNPTVSRTGQVRLVPPSGSFPVNGFATYTASLPVIGALAWDDVTPPEALAADTFDVDAEADAQAQTDPETVAA